MIDPFAWNPSASRVAARYKSKKKIETKDGDEATVYEYGPRQVANRHKEKAERVEHLRNHISDLRERVKDDLKSDDPHTRMTALAVSLMDHTCERVGNDDSADNGHYGVTGWLKKHITVRDGKATIKYVGKSGVKHEKTVDDGPTVTALKELCEGRGGDEAVFDTDDAKVSADDVNDYLAEFDVTAKDIRGYRANDEMCKALRAERAKGPKDLPRARKEKDEILKAEFKRALETVAEVVGHEAATLRSQYLVPGLEDQYVHDGTVLKSLKVGTKTDAQREDEATEKLVKPAPKKKPPRHDLRSERVESDDPDLDSEDDDLSLNFKKVAGEVLVRQMAMRVASRYLWAKGKANKQLDEEFLKSVEGKLFKTPKSDQKDGISYSHLKKIDPDKAKEERDKWVKGKREEKGKQNTPEQDQAEKREKLKQQQQLSPATSEEVQQSVGKIQSSEAAKSLSESDRERVSDLISSVMSGQKRVDKEKLEAGIEQHNAGNVEKLKGGVNRKTVDDLRRVPKGIYGEGVKMSTFDSKKSGELIAKKQKSREKVEKDYEQARNDVRDLPSEIKESEDREKVENQDLESETKTLKDLEAKVEKAGENADPKDKADITRLKAKVSTRQRTIQKLKVTRGAARKKLTAAQKRLPSLKDSYEKETSELNAMTAYHVSQEHLSSHLTDMSKGSDNPAKRLSEAAKHLSSLPPEMADKAREGAKAHRDQIKKDYDNAAEEDREALKKELDLADSVVAAGVHDKYLRMDEKEAEEDNKASFIRTLHGAGVGADDEHVQALLQEGSSQKDVAKAVHNLAQKMPKGALARRDFGDIYDMFADSPYISGILEQSSVNSLVGEFQKGRVKGKGDKAKADKAKADRVKQLAETANTEDLTDEQRGAIKKVVRDKAKDLPAADRETVTDIVELDIPDAASAPEGDGGKKKGPSSPGEYRQMLLDNAKDEETRKRVKDLSSEELNEKWETYKSGKTARVPSPRRLATRFLAYSTAGR